MYTTSTWDTPTGSFFRWGGTQIIFWWSVWPEVRNPYPWRLRIFLTQKRLIRQLFQNFHKSRPISKNFSASKMADFTIFCKFCEMGPSSKDFLLTKMKPMSKDFWWKSNPFGWHILVSLNMWVPPGLFSTRKWCYSVQRKRNVIWSWEVLLLQSWTKLLQKN